MTHSKRNTVRSARRQRGLSLVELLVAIVIGAVLIFGATQAYVDSRNAYMVNESVARLQETARFAMSVIEPDVRMSNHWGLVKGADVINNKKAKTAAADTTLASRAATDCGPNYGIDLENNVEGTDASYPAAAAATGLCSPKGGAMPTADTLTVRRASRIVVDPATAANGPLRICTTRTSGVLVTDLTGPLCSSATPPGAGIEPVAQINDLMVSLYYIGKDSDEKTGLPSLRRQWLDNVNKKFEDREIISNVEDMQVQFGVDPTGGFGVKGGAATRYLDPGTTLDNLLKGSNPAQIVSVRIWLLVRADAPEVGFTDNRVYVYGSRTDSANTTGDLTADATKGYAPSKSSDTSATGPMHYRRVLVSRTITIRNALGT